MAAISERQMIDRESNQIERMRQLTESNENAVRKYASNYLGFSYDFRSQETIQKVVNEETEAKRNNQILVEERGCQSEFVIEEGIETGLAALDRQFGFHLTVPVGHSVNAGAHIELQESQGHATQSAALVCIASCIKVDRCKYKMLPVVDTSPDLRTYGLAIITSATCYVGYRLFFEIFTQEGSVDQNRQVGGGVNVDVSGFGGLGFDVQRAVERLKGRAIREIRIRAEGIGGYLPGFANNEEGARQVIENFKLTFAECARQFRINPSQDLKYYFELRLPHIIRQMDISRIQVQEGHKLRELLGTIGSEVESSLKRDQKSTDWEFPNGFAGELLWATQEIFSEQFKQMPEKTAEPYCLVLGKTGAGKSALIGYLLGCKMEKKEILEKGVRGEIKRSVIDYANLSQDDSEYPKIGHGTSQTKGTLTYKGYLDSAGIDDLGGDSARICNAIGTGMAARHYTPQRIVLMLSPDALNTRGEGFDKWVQRLRAIIPGIGNEELLDRVLFAFNDETGRKVSKDDILDKIDLLLHNLIEERNKCLDARSEELKKSTIWTEELVRRADRSIPRIADEFQQRIEILYNVLTKTTSIVVVDFTNATSKNEIGEWLQKPLSSNNLNIAPEKLVPNSRFVFDLVLRGARLYFQDLFAELRSCEEQVERANLTIELIKKNAAEERDALDRQIQDFSDEQQSLKKQIDQLDGVIDAMETDEKIVFLRDLESEIPIKPRPLYSLMDDNASSYTFKIPDNLNVVKCEYEEGASSHPGTFDPPSEVDFIKKRQAKYTPARGSFKKNCNTVVRLFVFAKDHPNVKLEVSSKHKQRALLARQASYIAENLRHLENQVKGLRYGESECQEIVRRQVEPVSNRKREIEDILSCTQQFRDLLDRISL